MENKLEKLYTLKEVADGKYLGYKHQSIRNLVKSGQLRSITMNAMNGRPTYRIPESAIIEFKEKFGS